MSPQSATVSLEALQLKIYFLVEDLLSIHAKRPLGAVKMQYTAS